MATKSEITAILRSELADHPIGARLPGVAEVCERFDVSTSVGVYAHHPLMDEGLVESRRGPAPRGGYFVVAHPAKPSSDKEEVVRELRAEIGAIRRQLLGLDALLDQLI